VCYYLNKKKRVLILFYFMNKVKIKFVKKEKKVKKISLLNLLKKIKLSLKCCHVTCTLFACFSDAH